MREIGVVGIGECGGRLADEFAARGFPSMVVNLCSSDYRGLGSIPREHVLILGDGLGSGRDQAYSAEVFAENRDILMDLFGRVEGSVGKPFQVCFICCSLGGGTGGGGHRVVASEFRERGIPFMILAVMPRRGVDGPRSLRVALENITFALEQEWPICLVSNEVGFSRFGGGDNLAVFRKINSFVVSQIVRWLSLAYTGTPVVDLMDKVGLLTTPGFHTFFDVQTTRYEDLAEHISQSLMSIPLKGLVSACVHIFNPMRSSDVATRLTMLFSANGTQSILSSHQEIPARVVGAMVSMEPPQELLEVQDYLLQHTSSSQSSETKDFLRRTREILMASEEGKMGGQSRNPSSPKLEEIIRFSSSAFGGRRRRR